MEFLTVIFLSYVLGCISVILILIFLFIRYGLHPAESIFEQEQYQTYRPIAENDLAKNSTVDAINYLFQFLFQEMKDTSKLRRYILKKLNIEIDDIKKTKIGRMFLQDISILSYSLGKECPTFSDIQLERQERDGRELIKEFVTKLNIDYKDGFSVTLDIKLRFGYKCQLYIKVKRIEGRLRLEFRREPFSHWLVVFQDEPFIDFDVRAYISSRESPQLSQLITQRIRRIIRRKQIWPAYKIRFPPFFTKPTPSVATEVLTPKGNNLIPGKFQITIKHCDRLSLPYEIYPQDEYSSLSVFLTISLNEHIFEDYLNIKRYQWTKIQLEFIPKLYKINIKEINYLNRTEFLVDRFSPIPNDIDDRDIFRTALEDKNLFLLEIQGQQIKNLKQINRFIHDNDKPIIIIVGIPVLQCVQIPRYIADIDESMESDSSIQSQQELNLLKKNSGSDKITLVMTNDDLLEKLQAKTTATQQAEPYIKFDYNVDFNVGIDERYMNVCLWSKPTFDYHIPNVNKKIVLIGYATIALSEIVIDAHMSFKRETQMVLNFHSIHADYHTTWKKKKLTELSTHKNYDKNLVNGFVTINVKHQPAIDITFKPDEPRERADSAEPVIIDKYDEQLTPIDEEPESPTSKSVNHLFEDRTFHIETVCAYCSGKIWTKSGCQCRNCSIKVHKKCEERYNTENKCTRERIQSKSSMSEEESSLQSTDDNDTRTNKIKTYHQSKKTDVPLHRSFDGLGRTTTDRRSYPSIPSSVKNYDLDNKSSSPQREKRSTLNQPVRRSSTIASAASSAYSKLRDLRAKKATGFRAKKAQSFTDGAASENISEQDLQDIITKCLSDENVDIKSLETLFREKAVDHTAVYAKANQFGAELFRDYTLEERKQKLDTEISRLQQEIDLQGRIRDETIIEYNNHNPTDENAKRKIQEKIANIDEKIQALAALTIFYCSGLRYCCSEIEKQADDSSVNSKKSCDNSNTSDNEQ